jgi:predicted esterase
MSRRRFTAMAWSAAAAAGLHAGCESTRVAALGNDGRLSARPQRGVRTSIDGTQPLGLELTRDAYLHLPAGAGAGPLPLVVLLHGATGSGDRFLRRLQPALDQAGAAVLAPSSRDSTWDAIRNGFGDDVRLLDRALDLAFRRVAIDPDRVIAAGFSDGATYALSLGLINGDLFTRVVAFSPGFVVEGRPHGRTHVFISHGTADPILPIDRCSRRIVPMLQQRGYPVTFREFAGGHEVPADIAREALGWAAGAVPAA